MRGNSIEKSFTRSADTYDEFSGVQKKTARRLIEMTSGRYAGDILEIGCGTGNYTALLRECYPSARITAMDISEAMVNRAREKLKAGDITFVVMDAQVFPDTRTYDIVTSNACFHWLDDVDTAIRRFASMLGEGGLLTASIFGPRTFCELTESLNSVGKSVPVRAQGFPSDAVIRAVMAKHFKTWETLEASYSRVFDSVIDLLRAIKYSGVRGDVVAPGFLFTPDLIKKVEAHYRREYGSITATFQVFFCKGWG